MCKIFALLKCIVGGTLHRIALDSYIRMLRLWDTRRARLRAQFCTSKNDLDTTSV